MGSLDYMQFKVLYKLPNAAKAVQLDYVFGSLKELMQNLAIEGITQEGVDFLYVHYTPRGSNEVMELVATDNTKKKDRQASSNVVPINTVAHIRRAVDSKPRIRCQVPNRQAGEVAVHQGLYTAVAARG